MSTAIQLIALRCLQCSQHLSNDAHGIFLYCSSCGLGFELQRQQELVQVPVYFARKKQDTGNFLPFWAFDATLRNPVREAKGGIFSNPKGLIHLFEQRQVIRFYTPGFLRDLESKEPLALQLTYEQPELQFVHPQKQLPAVEISQQDARKIADYLLIASEIEQSDTLRSLQYQLMLENPMLICMA
jgi:hypothetical protein